MMKMPLAVIRLTAAAGALVACASIASAQNPFRFAGAPCVAPPVYKCPEANCPADRISNPGPVVEMKTRRTYFLDYPCDLKPGEPVTFILSLHGAGAPGNWQRHYFPLLDYKDRYRLVIATPNSPTRVWSDVDDDYLHNIVDTIVEQIGKQNIRAFWLVGHSQGGMTSNRIVRTDYFKDKVDGWLSLSGGRLGTNPSRGNFAGMAAPPGAARGAAPAGGRGAAPPTAAATGLPPTDFSFIYETGQREMDEKGLPEVSQWAQRLGCGPRGKPTDIVDTKGGSIYDTSRQNPPVPAWGLIARPGTAQVSQYSNCNDGRIVADVVRLEKGHTEGLEPNITEELVKLMLSAKGGKLHP